MSALALVIRFTIKPVPVQAAHEQHKLGFWIYLFFLVCWLAVCNALGHMEVAAIPPIIVVGFEVMSKKVYTTEALIKQVVILSLSALAGAYSLYFLQNLLATVLVDLLVVFFLLHILKAKMPPAYAISLLPMVIQFPSPWIFGVCVFGMSLVIFTLIYFWKKLAERRLAIYYARSLKPALKERVHRR
jgi:hypothetical protein